ncbi:MAG: methylated-DNA--[protein]-cysteine S-methyltransferase [Deltaproteobacteria bacterium]|nr:methylated-DNA--[protein]-cysteine S-methyltransferase [Deltaproteobacteria bacterium]
MSPSTKKPKPALPAQAVVETPVGLAFMFFSDKGLTRLAFAEEKDFKEGVMVGGTPETESLPKGLLQEWHQRVAQALEDYFTGDNGVANNLPLDLKGTPFQLRVWQELRKIPRRETISYQELARRAGSPQAARAAGQACGANPVPILIPCHRVVAADGSLGGYSSGLERKRWLLKHEGVNVEKGKGRKGENK